MVRPVRVVRPPAFMRETAPQNNLRPQLPRQKPSGMDLNDGAVTANADTATAMEIPFEIEFAHEQWGDSTTLESTEVGREGEDDDDNDDNHNNRDPNDPNDDRTLFAAHLDRSDENAYEAFSRRRRTSNMKKKAAAKRLNKVSGGSSHHLPLILAIVIACLVLAASIAVIALSVRTYRQQQQQKNSSASNDLLRTSASPSTSSSTLTPTPDPARSPLTTPHRPAPTVAVSTLSPARTTDTLPVSPPTPHPGTIVFYALGDAPYNETQAETLRHQLANVPDDAEFIVHLGDMRKAGHATSVTSRNGPHNDNNDDDDGAINATCRSDDYELVRKIFRLSKVPVLIVVGDNDVNDCSNPDEAVLFWEREFLEIPEQGWGSLPFVVQRRDHDQADQYHFEHKNTLFLALRLIGGNATDQAQRDAELLDQWRWAEAVMEEYRVKQLAAFATGRVVMFAHADPTIKHEAFFEPFRAYYAIYQAQLALLYLNGDRHEWVYNNQFMGFRHAKQITVSGETVDPLLKIMVHTVENRRGDPFQYDRRLVDPEFLL